jgi:hypothetical protein
MIIRNRQPRQCYPDECLTQSEAARSPSMRGHLCRPDASGAAADLPVLRYYSYFPAREGGMEVFGWVG